MNIFEGARRISTVLQALWAGGCIVGWYFDDPYVRANYFVSNPDAVAFYSATLECEIGRDAIEYVTTKVDGKTINVTLCFLAQKFSDGRLLVPFKGEGEKVWGNDRYSADVSTYAKAAAAKFQVHAQDHDTLKELYKKEAKEERKEYGMALFIGVGVIWIVTAGMGWIIRGFMGIPTGQDRTSQ
ncbi:MAG TPA: hypothetical protein VM240_05485 [Verrucomicrobiae bacterium]|nr:hypothetical protein [Verrucomicrobiae bacterium]